MCEVSVRGADRVAVDPLGGDALAAAALDGVVDAQHHRAVWRKSGNQQVQQQPGCQARVPRRPVQNSMVVHEAPLVHQPANAQQAGDRARAGRQDGADQQHLGTAPTPLAEQRREAQDDRGKAEWQTKHGRSLGGDTPASTARPLRHPTQPQMANVELRLRGTDLLS